MWLQNTPACKIQIKICDYKILHANVKSDQSNSKESEIKKIFEIENDWRTFLALPRSAHGMAAQIWKHPKSAWG